MDTVYADFELVAEELLVYKKLTIQINMSSFLFVECFICYRWERNQ